MFSLGTNITILSACLGLFLLIIRLILIIPARKVAICERLGKFNRILWPGMHFIFYPFEYTRIIRWTYFNQNNKLQRLNSNTISIDNCQLDIPPIKCLTLDNIVVDIDSTLMYGVTDPKKAVYNTDDVLNMFYQTMHNVIKTCVRQVEIDYIQLNSLVLAEDIKSAFEDAFDVKKTGIKLENFILQDIKTDTNISAANEKIMQTTRQHNLKMKQLKANREEMAMQRSYDHDSKMKQLKTKRDEDIMQQEIETKKAKYEYDKREKALAFKLKEHQTQMQMRLKEAETDQERQKMQWSKFTPEQIIELEKLKTQRSLDLERLKTIEVLQNNTTVYAPLEYFNNPIKLLK